MQSIWFGRQERLFGSEEEREILIDYTKKAVDFAVAIQCAIWCLDVQETVCFQTRQSGSQV